MFGHEWFVFRDRPGDGEGAHARSVLILQAVGLFAEADGAVIVVVGVEAMLLLVSEQVSEPFRESAAEERGEKMYIGQTSFTVKYAVYDVVVGSDVIEERVCVPVDASG